MEACLWQLGFTQLCHKVSKNDFKVTEQLSLLLNSGEVLTRICFRAELDFILIGKQHSDLSSNFLNSGGGQVFLQHHIFHISLVHVRTTFKNGHRRPCWLLRVEKIWENPFSLRKWNIMGQNTLKINEGICQRVIRTCKKSTLIWKNFPIKKYLGVRPNHRTWSKSKKLLPKISICRFAGISPYEKIKTIWKLILNS